MNGDLKLRAAIDTEAVAWVPLAEGVEEKLLEDAGARRTALVRLAAGAELDLGTAGAVSAGTFHAADVLVLDGELEGVPAGTFVHGLPALAAIRPTIAFVKQRPAERPTWGVDTRHVVFEDTDTPGLTRASLYLDDHGEVVLLRFAPGTVIGPHRHVDGEELFVLDGELSDEHGRYTRGWWVRQPAGSVHAITSPGCVTLTFAHHLR